MYPLIVKIVMGECESCCFNEKIWVSHVVINRVYSSCRFNPIEKDFQGLNRDISNSYLTKQQLFLTMNAVMISYIQQIFGFDPTNKSVFFCNGPPNNLSFYKLKANRHKGFIHVYYAIDER